MLENLRPFINRTPTSMRISMPNMATYLSNLSIGVDRLIERNLDSVTDPVPTVGIDYLNSLIIRADIQYLLQYPNDMERLSRIDREYKKEYSDFIRQHPVKVKAFVYSEVMRTAEYLLITDDFNILDNLPLGSVDLNQWMTDVRPMRMLSNDSFEIQMDNTTSRLRYRRKPPTEVVYSINVIKLLMLYTKYRIMEPEAFAVQETNYPFIYKACIIPTLKDNTKVWLTKIIHDMVLGHLGDENYKFNMDDLIYGEKSQFVHNGLDSAMRELATIIQRCADGEAKADELMVSIKTSEGMSLLDDIEWLMDSHYVGNRGNQYQWTEFVREYYLLTTMMALHKLNPDTNRSKELCKLFKIVSRRLGNTKFWNHVTNPFISDGVKNKFEVMTSLCV